jgi:ribose transport system permease protein
MTQQTDTPEGAAPAPDTPKGARFQWGEAVGLLIFYVLLVVALSLLSPYFLSINNFTNILISVSSIGIMAGATTMVIVSGGLDLSIGSVVGLTGVAVAQLSNTMPIVPAALLALGIGTLVGVINGVAVTKVRINPLIATLATLSIARGFAFVFAGGLTQTINSPGFAFLGQGRIGNVPLGALGTLQIPFQVLVMLALFVLAAWVMRSTVFGRSVYAIGGNEQAARLAGLPVRRMQMWLYVLSGLSAALAGIFLASQLGAGAPQAATGIELSVIAAVILGGTSLTGGKGTIWGAFLGVLILGTLNNGLTLLQVNSYYQEVARGTVLLFAVGLDQLRVQWANRS